MIDGDATLSQQLFHVSAGEPVAQIPANRDHDQIRREAKTPAKLDLSSGTRRARRRINRACLILLSTDATAFYQHLTPDLRRDITHQVDELLWAHSWTDETKAE
jgi:hypothetical protein